MKKFRLTMYIGNCENFGTEWEELRKEVEIIEAESREELEEEYNDTIHDCDVKSYYIEELGVPCFKVMIDGKCAGQYVDLENAFTYFRLCLYDYEDDMTRAVGKIKIEIGVIE